MHTPPTETETQFYKNSGRGSYYLFSLISISSLVTGLLLFTVSSHYFYWFGMLTLLLTFYLGISLFIGIFGLKKHSHFEDILPDSELPDIDVYLPCCGEDLAIIENTYKSVSQLIYPKEKINVYILNDCKDTSYCYSISKLADKYGFKHFERPNKGELKKAGNLRYAFAKTSGKYFLILDADFCPNEKMLQFMATDLEKNPDVAIVQTPQFFTVEKEQTWVEKGAGFIQELFYRLVQVSRNRWGGSICVGTCALYRREALAPFGGTAEIGYSEDVHTGFMLVNNGWKLKYVSHILSKGNCPDTTSSFFVQQYRWATGSISLFLNKEFWKSNLSVMQKLCYLSGMLYYILTGIGVFAIQVPSLLLMVFSPDKIVWFNTFFSLPSFLFGIVFVKLWSKAPWGWYAVKARQLSYYAHFCAVVDKFRGQLIPWQATGAVKASERYREFCSYMLLWISAKTTLIFTLAIYYTLNGNFEITNFVPVIIFTLIDLTLNLQVIMHKD